MTPDAEGTVPTRNISDSGAFMELAQTFAALLADERIQKALAYLRDDQNTKVEEQKEMALVSGAPHTETKVRSPMYLAKLQGYGVENCFIDEAGNAMGYVRGASARPKVVLEAHLDTVFDAETPLNIVERNGKIYCPGIGDDTAGLACVLSVARAIRHAGLKPAGTLMVGGVAGEEAPGNSRGVIELMNTHQDIDAYVAVETCWTRRITRGGIACRRWELTFRGPGGHSWQAWGLPSPLHAAGRAVSVIAALQPPADPKTTLNVGTIHGGTSVNSIANETTVHVDIRSVSESLCEEYAIKIREIAEQAVADENTAHPSRRSDGNDRVSVRSNLYCVKPGGDQSPESPIVQAAILATRAVGVEPDLFPPSSTNANFPIAMGIPSVCVGAGGDGGNLHTLDEWYDPSDSYTGAQKVLLLIFALAGLEGVAAPLAPVRT